MWKNSLKNVESDHDKTFYETLLDFFYSESVLNFCISLVYVIHLYSTVLEKVFLRYLTVSSSKNFSFKNVFSAGAVNAVSAANPFPTEKSNIFLAYILNSELGSFSE